MSARRRIATDMAEAATAWLDSLDTVQAVTARGATPVHHDGEADDPAAHDAERRRWFYTPTDHGGLALHQQRPAQQRAAVRLLATGLSEAGFTTVAAVMGLENVLDRLEGFTVSFGRERGRDPGLYYLRVFGEPGPMGAWGWRFGGHHVSVNHLVVDGEVVATTPCFLGADPAAAPLLGGLQHRPLAAVEDLARELLRSLPRSLQERAVLLDRPPPDLVTANRTQARPGDRALPLTRVWRDQRFRDEDEQHRLQLLSDTIDRTAGLTEHDHARLELTEQPQGLAAAELDTTQRELLRAVLLTYTGRVPDGLAPSYDDDALDHVHLAWAGSTEPGAPHYYRLQGPRLLVEWDNTQRGANHAHSVWRDPEADFGLDVLRRHRAAHH